MANKTIYGCVNRGTGAITFEGEACGGGDYTGCIVRTGEHAGQVAVIVDETNCDDTYYGCVNRTTGAFEVQIPDDCCRIFGDDCGYCTAGETPKYLYATVNGLIFCSGCYASNGNSWRWVQTYDPNDLYTLTQSIVDPCDWASPVQSKQQKMNLYFGGGCSDFDREVAGGHELYVKVYRRAAGKMEIYVGQQDEPDFYSGLVNISGGCVAKTSANNTNSCGTDEHQWYSGTVSITES